MFVRIRTLDICGQESPVRRHNTKCRLKLTCALSKLKSTTDLLLTWLWPIRGWLAKARLSPRKGSERRRKLNKWTAWTNKRSHRNLLFLPRSGIEPGTSGNSDIAKTTTPSAHGYKEWQTIFRRAVTTTTTTTLTTFRGTLCTCIPVIADCCFFCHNKQTLLLNGICRWLYSLVCQPAIKRRKFGVKLLDQLF